MTSGDLIRLLQEAEEYLGMPMPVLIRDSPKSIQKVAKNAFPGMWLGLPVFVIDAFDKKI